MLTAADKTQRMAYALTFSELYHKYGDDLLNQIVRVQIMKPGLHVWILKPQSSQSSGCTHIHQTSRKSLNKRLPARKLMATVFWDRKGVLMVEFMQQGTTVTPEVYCGTRKACVDPFWTKRRGMLTYGVVLLHDNVRPHTAARIWALLEHFNSLRATTTCLLVSPWRTSWDCSGSTVLRSS
jgi:hypothetical protein